MSNRHLSRTIAMQTLYEWDFSHRQNEKIIDILKHNLREFAPDFDDNGFTENLVKGIIKHLPEINQYIKK